MYKSISAAYTVIVLSYWQLAFCGYWAFGSQVHSRIDCCYGKLICSYSNLWMLSGRISSTSNLEYVSVLNFLSSGHYFLISPVVRDLVTLDRTWWSKLFYFAFFISFCFQIRVTILTPCIVYQIYCRPTYTYFEGSIESNKSTSRFRLRIQLIRLFYTSIYMTLVTLIAAAIPFFGDFVSICGAIGFTPLDFVFLALAYLKAGNIAKNSKLGILMKLLNILIATWFSLVAVLGCIGAVRSIVEDIKNYKFFYLCRSNALTW